MCIILEVDKRWLIRFEHTKHAISLSLGFIAITIWKLPYALVLELYQDDAVEKHIQARNEIFEQKR